eukprot:4790747-Prymnesium_polylepis.1
MERNGSLPLSTLPRAEAGAGGGALRPNTRDVKRRPPRPAAAVRGRAAVPAADATAEPDPVPEARPWRRRMRLAHELRARRASYSCRSTSRSCRRWTSWTCTTTAWWRAEHQ